MIREAPTKKKETPATDVWDQLPYTSMFGRETRLMRTVQYKLCQCAHLT